MLGRREFFKCPGGPQAIGGIESSTGRTSFNHNDLASALHSKTSSPYPDRLKTFLKEVEEADVVSLVKVKGPGGGMVTLNPNLRLGIPSFTTASTANQKGTKGSKSTSPTPSKSEFKPQLTQ
jgi:hypothetical protein